MSTLNIYRAKAVLLAATLITLCFFASFSRLTRAQGSATQATPSEDPIIKEIAAYRTWQRVNTRPQFILDGADS